MDLCEDGMSKIKKEWNGRWFETLGNGYESAGNFYSPFKVVYWNVLFEVLKGCLKVYIGLLNCFINGLYNK